MFLVMGVAEPVHETPSVAFTIPNSDSPGLKVTIREALSPGLMMPVGGINSNSKPGRLSGSVTTRSAAYSSKTKFETNMDCGSLDARMSWRPKSI